MSRTVLKNSQIIDFLDIAEDRTQLRIYFKIKMINGMVFPRGGAKLNDSQIDHKAFQRLLDKIWS